MKKIYILLFMFVSLSYNAIAQMGDQYVTLQYSMGIGMGDSYDFVSKYSFRGVSLDYKRFLTDRLAIGADFNWNVLFQELPYDTYTKGSVSLSGNQDRSLNFLPMMATVDYLFADNDSEIQPFAGLGIGTVNTIHNVDMGMYRANYNEWHFGLKPQVGIWYYVSETSKVSISSEYIYAFKTQNVSAQKLLTFNIGMAFMLQ